MNIMPVWFACSPAVFVDIEKELQSYDEDMNKLFYTWGWAAVELPGVDDYYWNEYNKLKHAQNQIIEGHCIAIAAGF